MGSCVIYMVATIEKHHQSGNNHLMSAEDSHPHFQTYLFF